MEGAPSPPCRRQGGVSGQRVGGCRGPPSAPVSPPTTGTPPTATATTAQQTTTNRYAQAEAEAEAASLRACACFSFPSYPSTTVAPCPGTWVIPRRPTGSDRSLVGRTVQLSNNVLSTMRISYSANAAPRQRRTPPPKGIQV
jgi:hypothetical protein